MLKNNPLFPSDLKLPVLKEDSRQLEMKESKSSGWDLHTHFTPPAQALLLGSNGINSNFAGGKGGFTAELQKFSLHNSYIDLDVPNGQKFSTMQWISGKNFLKLMSPLCSCYGSQKSRATWRKCSFPKGLKSRTAPNQRGLRQFCMVCCIIFGFDFQINLI